MSSLGRVAVCPIRQLIGDAESPLMQNHYRVLQARIEAFAVSGFADCDDSYTALPTIARCAESFETRPCVLSHGFYPVAVPDGQLIHTSYGGETNRPKTSITRYFVGTAVGLIALNESAYVAGCILTRVAEESLNAAVGPHPAAFMLMKSSSGRHRASLLWWDSTVLYALQAWHCWSSGHSAQAAVVSFATRLTQAAGPQANK